MTTRIDNPVSRPVYAAPELVSVDVRLEAVLCGSLGNGSIQDLESENYGEF